MSFESNAELSQAFCKQDHIGILLTQAFSEIFSERFFF